MSTKRSPIIEHFSCLEDPRIERHKKHLLVDIVVIAVCASLCGIDDFEGMEIFAESRVDWLKQFLQLPGGIPSHDTINRVFRKIDSQKFQECFLAWMQDVVQLNEGEIVAIDGKTLRRSFDRASAKSAIHMVSAWASANGVVLGQIKVDEKSNEIAAVPKLLDSLVLSGCLVTLDAMGCQRQTCQKIVEQKADYLVSLKGNQGKLHEDVKVFFETFAPKDDNESGYNFHQTKDNAHGRQERRRYYVTDDIKDFLDHHQWPGLTSIGMVKSTRIIDGLASYEERYFITSMRADAEKFAAGVRGHWQVENGLHWQLDVNFNEDSCRVRRDFADENLSTIRRVALNLLKKQPDKLSIPKKRLTCCLQNDYLLKVLLS